MLKLCKVTKVKVFFPVMVYVFNFELFQFSAAILEKGLLRICILFQAKAVQTSTYWRRKYLYRWSLAIIEAE